MKKLSFFLVLLFLATAGPAGCGGGKEESVSGTETVNLTVSAAASLKDAAEELKSVYSRQQPGVSITYNFAASGTLQKQIEEGAPVDLFISAGKTQMDALAEKGLIINESRIDLLNNELVLIAKNDTKLTGFEGLADPGVKKISIGTPESVPAGKYAREALTALGLWDSIRPRLVLAKDVRQVLTYVETGNVDAGLVYRSDAMIGREIKVIASAPTDSHAPIVYPLAVIKNTRHLQEAKAFAAFLSSSESAGVFEKYGFKVSRK